MCPYSNTGKPGPANHMDERIYQRLLESLHSAGTVRIFALMLQNEPLLDPMLVQRVCQAREILGDAVHTAIVTNGSLMTPQYIDDLLDAGIDSIEISVDAFREETYRDIRPGLKFSKVMENIRTLLHRNSGARVVVRFLRQRENAGEEKQFKRYWESNGAQVFFLPMVNRVGMLKGFEQMNNPSHNILGRCKKDVWNLFLRTAARSAHATPCLLPFTWLNVLWDGRAILCCHDWGPLDIIGNFTSQSLREVWNSDAINSYRQLLWNNNIDKSLVCKDCSIVSRT